MNQKRIAAILLLVASLGDMPARARSEQTDVAPSASRGVYKPDGSPASQAAPDKKNWYEPLGGNCTEDGCNSACKPDLGCDACPRAYGQVESLLLWRDPRTIRQPVIIDFNTGETVLSTSNLDFDYDAGVRVTAGVRLRDYCWALEFSYLGVFDAKAFASARATDDETVLTFPGPPLNVFFGADRIDLDYSSRLHSFELNLPCCYCCDAVRCRSFEYFAGFRYLNLEERLSIFGQRNQDEETEEGVYDIRTRNNLYGAQLGARVRSGWDRFRWEATGKAGIFGNDAQQRQYLVDFPDFFVRPPVSGRGGQASFVGEINLAVIYRLTDVWGMRAGYNLLWIEGVALAPDQLDFAFFTDPSGNGLNNSGGLFLHGLSVGLEARW